MIDQTEPTDDRASRSDRDPAADHVPANAPLILVGGDADDLVCVDDTCLPPGTQMRAPA